MPVFGYMERNIGCARVYDLLLEDCKLHTQLGAGRPEPA